MHTLIRRVFGVMVIVAIIWGFYSIPYNILREERVRLYGEIRTSGLVLSARTGDSKAAREPIFIIEYKYVDPDGFAHTTEARLPRNAWGMYRPGSSVEVIYAKAKPTLSRVPHEIEPPFQVWLRDRLQ